MLLPAPHHSDRLVDQDRPEVVHVRERRASDKQVAKPFESGIGIVIGEIRLETDPERLGARWRIRQEERACIVLASINAVRISGKGCYSCLSVKRQTEAQKEFGITPAASVSTHRNGCLPAGYHGARDVTGLSAFCDLLRDRGMNEGDVARLAFDGVAQDERTKTCVLRHAGGGLE